MGSFRMGGMTFSSLFKKPETVRYPYEQKPAPEGLKGHVENNVENCILCGICQKTCPSDAIVVDKANRLWTIDPFRCVQCGSCVRACPKHCLEMLPTYTSVSTTKFCNTVEVPEVKKEKKTAEKASAAKKEADANSATPAEKGTVAAKESSAKEEAAIEKEAPAKVDAAAKVESPVKEEMSEQAPSESGTTEEDSPSEGL